MNPAPSTTSAPAPTGDVRIGELAGDRVCANCSFNLINQTIVREPVYGLLLVRCPECGTPAPIQEYPMLGRWAGRLAFVAAAAWLTVLLAFLAVNVAIVSTGSYAIGEQLVGNYAATIVGKYEEFTQTNSPPSPGTLTSTPWGGTVQCSQEWWDAQDHAALLAKAGGWVGAVDHNALKQLVFPLLGGAALGSIWVIALPHLRAKRRFLPLLIVLTISTVVLAIVHATDEHNQWSWAFNGGTLAALQQLGWTVYWMPLAVWAVAYTIGAFIGRPIARLVIPAMLPPRLRAPWSFLWICDGRPLPRPPKP